jgi:hypothetical protein
VDVWVIATAVCFGLYRVHILVQWPAVKTEDLIGFSKYFCTDIIALSVIAPKLSSMTQQHNSGLRRQVRMFLDHT